VWKGALFQPSAFPGINAIINGGTIVHISIRNSIYLLLGLIGFKATPALAAQDIFLCIEGVPGESQDERHRDCIDVLAWSWGMSQSGTTHDGTGGGGVDKVSVQDLSVTKYIDKSSPDIMLATASGAHFPKLELLVHQTCGGCDPKQPYFSLTIEDIIVSSVSSGGSQGEDRLTENVTFNFAKVQWCYTQTNPDGSQEPEHCEGWDIVTNTPQ